MNTVLVLLFLACCFSPVVLSQPPNPRHYFKLALQWPFSVCNSGTPCSPPNPFATVPPPQHRFTIHGFWPDIDPRQGPTAPANCHNIPYTPIQRQNQLADMNLYWPNVEKKFDNVRFWTREWLKHGTCAQPQMTQEQYFDKALELVKRLRLEDKLNAGGLKIGTNTAADANVTLMIQKSLGVLPEVVCNTKKQTTTVQLKEIRICYDHPSDSWITCPSASNPCTYPYELPQ